MKKVSFYLTLLFLNDLFTFYVKSNVRFNIALDNITSCLTKPLIPNSKCLFEIL